MFKPTKNKILLSLLISIVILIIYIIYFKFFYISSEPCHLVDCLITEKHINFWIRPTCCGYTMKKLLTEIISVILSSFLVSYLAMSIINRKK
jgi:hypothetical protein